MAESNRRVFPGRADQVRAARQFVSCALPLWAEAMVAELLVSEAATNTLLHTNSGQPGGAFQVSYTISGQWLRVEVADQGAPTGPARRLHGPEALTGRGLELFDSLAPSWGVSESSDGRTVWFELDLHGVQLHSEQTEADTPGRVAGR